MTARKPIAFARIASAARAQAESIVSRWLPSGRREGAEWIALNPTRGDAKPGSFKINLRTGSWADFATADRGGDLVSLAAYLFRLKQAEAALRVAGMLGLNPYE
ncbi:hypothetical protein [Bradyrhizobium embrapense]